MVALFGLFYTLSGIVYKRRTTPIIFLRSFLHQLEDVPHLEKLRLRTILPLVAASYATRSRLYIQGQFIILRDIFRQRTRRRNGLCALIPRCERGQLCPADRKRHPEGVIRLRRKYAACRGKRPGIVICCVFDADFLYPYRCLLYTSRCV